MIYKPTGVCANTIELNVKNNIIEDVKFLGGCDGNTTGISSLVKGMTVDEVIDRLEGIRCGNKKTSCPDQLTKALKKYKEQQ